VRQVVSSPNRAIMYYKRISKVIFILLISYNMPVYASDIVVTLQKNICVANFNGDVYHCSIGKNGITADKKEGDGKTPVGVFPLREILFRADKISKNELLNISLPLHAIKQYDGWCDEPQNKDYNKMVNLDHFDLRISHEDLYRDDDLYDLLIVVGYNDDPVIPYKGSAIFIHIAKPNYLGTAGCVGFSRSDLLKIIHQLDANSNLIVQNQN
jgi:L,D-peptidoglycan transpeptidase YkuD (ErfK/YbiS/YcfS/YnhG family)